MFYFLQRTPWAYHTLCAKDYIFMGILRLYKAVKVRKIITFVL